MTPVATAMGVIVYVAYDNTITNQISGVTYGGVAMTEVSLSPALHDFSEDVQVAGFFLGSGVPTGAQTVVVTVSGANVKIGYCITVTAAANTEVQATAVSTAANKMPTGTIALGGVSCFVSQGWSSGLNDPGATPLAGWTERDETDFGFRSSGAGTYDVIGTADVSIGWTGALDEIALLAVAIKESAGGGGTTPVSNDLGDSYALRANAASDLGDSYALRADIAADLADGYALRTTVSGELADSYLLRAGASADLGDSYALRADIASDLADSYAVDNASSVASELGDSYRVRAGVAGDLADAYALRAGVYSDLGDAYVIDSASGVGSSLADIYAIRAEVSGDLSDIYAVRTTVSADLEDDWLLRAGVAAEFVDLYSLRNFVSADFADAYLSAGLVSSDLVDAYAIDGELYDRHIGRRLYTVPPENRIYTVARENRIYTLKDTP